MRRLVSCLRTRPPRTIVSPLRTVRRVVRLWVMVGGMPPTDAWPVVSVICGARFMVTESSLLMRGVMVRPVVSVRKLALRALLVVCCSGRPWRRRWW